MLVDDHCHLDFEQFDKDRDEVISKCKQQGVDAIICNGVGPESNRKVLEIASKYDIVHAALGLYPSEALKMTDAEIGEVLNGIKGNKSKLVAIGEVGIDFFHIKDADKRRRECQIFERVVKLANELGLPCVVHSRKAEGKILELLEPAKVPVVMHFYEANAEQTKIAMRRGYFFSIPTAITSRKSMQKLAKRVPLNRILTETDAPYLCPERGERNDPTYIKRSIAKIAEIKGVSASKVEAQVRKNFKKVYGI